MHARVIQNEWAELEAAYLSAVLDLIIRHVSRRVRVIRFILVQYGNVESSKIYSKTTDKL